MFVLKTDAAYWWPVEYRMPKEDGSGKFDKRTFEAQFNALPQSRLDELESQQKAGQTISDQDFIDEVFKGWRGITTPDGEEAPVNAANRRVLLDLPGMRAAIILAYQDSVVGRLRKN